MEWRSGRPESRGVRYDWGGYKDPGMSASKARLNAAN
jgi:hypothetical protein